MANNKHLLILPSEHIDKEENNKGLNKLFNVFWFIFVGLFSVIENAILGVCLCCTIVGIPAGITCFKIMPLILKPAGRRVQLNFKSHPVLNTFAFIFGGLLNYLILNVLGIILCITVVGIPLGRQLFKLARFYLAPFGCEIHLDGTLTDKKDTIYDFRLLMTNIRNNPNKNVKMDNGEVLPASKAIAALGSSMDAKEIGKFDRGMKSVKRLDRLGGFIDSLPVMIADVFKTVLLLTVFIFVALIVITYIQMALGRIPSGNVFAAMFGEQNNLMFVGLHAVMTLAVILVLIVDIKAFIDLSNLQKLHKKYFIPLTTYFPNQTKLPTSSKTRKETVEYWEGLVEKTRSVYRSYNPVTTNKGE